MDYHGVLQADLSPELKAGSGLDLRGIYVFEIADGTIIRLSDYSWVQRTPNKALHTNRRPALGFDLSVGFFDAGWHYHVTVRAAVGDRSARDVNAHGVLPQSPGLPRSGYPGSTGIL